MSHEATNWAFKQPDLTPAQKLVLLCLADCHNPSHGCFPSQGYIAEVCNISRATVNRCLDELEKVGLISRENLKDEITRQQRPTRYYLAFENGIKAVSQIAKAVSHFEEKPCLILEESRVSKCDTNLVIDITVNNNPKTLEPEGFAEAFEAYPHHRPRKSRIDALKAFNKLPTGEQKALLASVTDYAGTLRPRDLEFVKGMGQWLRAGLHKNYGTTSSNNDHRASCIEAYRASGIWHSEWGEKPSKQELAA